MLVWEGQGALGGGGIGKLVVSFVPAEEEGPWSGTEEAIVGVLCMCVIRPDSRVERRGMFRGASCLRDGFCWKFCPPIARNFSRGTVALDSPLFYRADKVSGVQMNIDVRHEAGPRCKSRSGLPDSYTVHDLLAPCQRHCVSPLSHDDQLIALPRDKTTGPRTTSRALVNDPSSCMGALQKAEKALNKYSAKQFDCQAALLYAE